ncbi:hypothetical protein DICSQDRAFT_141524 [Dichomitus squalens LYAD-421 SS1]|uniref:Uncharacterized protein n=1 Tax=Dichomitus squalens (strain LYAD-421) TaxID=732165 RepID=R7SM14_DICSQ|nr:uncharacterized protein DICSQDRAFT_141524 [Dichomitus squalens LYAD-421 SS1]EJF56077.1 hypothetical protein DICSQDRAFT_141524 [Dichomitus squalens LYAD-421 SS1]
MFEPDFVPQPIHWQDKRDKALQLSRPDALTVAWVLEEQAWGTILEHPDDVRQLFDEAASEVLRQWAPYVDRVVYGDAGVLDTSVRFGKDGTFEILRQDELLGEDHWRKL